MLLSMRAFRPVGLFYCNYSIEFNKLNKRSVCVKKIFTSKNLWIKMFKKIIEIFSSIFGSRRAPACLGDKIKTETMRTITPCLPAQLRSFYSFVGKFRTRPSKIEKNCDFSKSASKSKQVYHTLMIICQSWKFHENRPNRFRQIFCTKSKERKILRIEKKKQMNNSNFQRKTLITTKLLL